MRTLLLCSLVVLTACGGGGGGKPNLFKTDWDNDNGASVTAFQSKAGAIKGSPGADVAVGIGGNGDKLIGMPLAGGNKWTFSHAMETRPAIAGGVVVGSGGGEVFGLDAMTGQKLWVTKVGNYDLRGAGDDGKVTVFTVGQKGGQGSKLIAIDRAGSVIREVDTDQKLAAPAIAGGHAFVPWGSQYITIYNVATGDEEARILIRGKVSHAIIWGGGLFFAEAELWRWDDRIKGSASNQASHLMLPPRELPGTPMLFTPGDESMPAVANAIDRTRLYARATNDGTMAFDSSRFYGSYFKMIMGFESDKGKLVWVWSNPQNDILGGAAGAGSFVACDESGTITTLDAATGGVAGTQSLGEPIKGCVVQADGYKAGAAQPPPPIAMQISNALLTKDPEMVSGQRLLLREIATVEDETATKTLVDLASDPRTPPQIVADARIAIAQRRNGAKYMLEALQRHYDFLHDVLRTPPVGPCAQALAAMKEKTAAPLLAAHLLDPADTDDDVKQAAAALIIIGDSSQLPQLKDFFAFYRAGAETGEVIEAAINAGNAILRIGGAEGRKIVDAAIADVWTVDPVKTKLKAIEEAFDAEVKSKPPPPKK